MAMRYATAAGESLHGWTQAGEVWVLTHKGLTLEVYGPNPNTGLYGYRCLTADGTRLCSEPDVHCEVTGAKVLASHWLAGYLAAQK